jgi:hypothetical protein
MKLASLVSLVHFLRVWRHVEAEDLTMIVFHFAAAGSFRGRTDQSFLNLAVGDSIRQCNKSLEHVTRQQFVVLQSWARLSKTVHDSTG